MNFSTELYQQGSYETSTLEGKIIPIQETGENIEGFV